MIAGRRSATPAWRPRPPAFEGDLIVIGAGPAGLTAAREQARHGGVASVPERDAIVGDKVSLHPHVHTLVTCGGWTADVEWVPVPHVSSPAAEQFFRHKVTRLLQRGGLLDEDRTHLLLSWRHSGFPARNSIRPGRRRPRPRVPRSPSTSSPVSSRTLPTRGGTCSVSSAPLRTSCAEG